MAIYQLPVNSDATIPLGQPDFLKEGFLAIEPKMTIKKIIQTRLPQSGGFLVKNSSPVFDKF